MWGTSILEEVKCLLQYPINVYPDNVTVDGTTDANDRKVHFTFKGDMLRAYVVRFFDYETGNVVVNDSPIYSYDSDGYYLGMQTYDQQSSFANMAGKEIKFYIANPEMAYFEIVELSSLFCTVAVNSGRISIFLSSSSISS